MIADGDVELAGRGVARRFTVAAVSAAMVGLTEAFSPASAFDGVLAALLFGLVWGVTRTIGLARRVRALGPLTRDEAARVIRAVDAGSSPDDPRLARAALVRVEQVRKANYPRPLLMIAPLAMLPLALLIIAIATRQPLVLAFQGISVGLWQGTLRLDRPSDRERAVMAAEFAARRARKALGLPLTPEPTAADLLRDKYDDDHPGWYRVVVSLAVTAAISGLTAAVTSQNSGGTSAHHFTAVELRKHGYRTVGTVHGAQFWVRLAGRTLRVRTIGSVEQLCARDVTVSPSGPYVPVGVDVCNQATSSVVAYVVDDTFHSAQVSCCGGYVTSQAIFDIGVELPDERLMIVLLPSGDTAGDVMFH